ncbi:MAG: glycosyltransferase [Terracidiphilus sp.]|jgi:glycosyltransferase involved in cell wall biosynthesis
MKQRPRVLLLIPHLGGGGAEQVTALLARGLSREKYELHLGLVTEKSAGKGELPPRIAVHALGAGRVRTGGFRLLKLVRRLKPELILSGMAHLNFLVLLMRPYFPKQTKVLVRQNGTVSSLLAVQKGSGVTRLLYKRLYPRADRVICQSKAMAKDLARELGIGEARLAVLPNPVDVDGIRNATGEDLWNGHGPHLLAVGRLSREKGFDLLLPALAAVRERFSHADLTIAGEGPEERALKALCRKLGLEAAVLFAGYVERPSAYFQGASVFVLSSRHEGLPNALLEAAAGGLPVVALPASQGVVELLRNQPGCWLAKEVSSAALEECLLTALSALKPSEGFEHGFIEEFRIDRAIRAYEDLIDETLAQRKL